MEKDGREFLIDAYTGDLFASPKSPGKQVLEKIKAHQCKSCFYHVAPEATFDCYTYISEGYVHPVKICVIADFHAEEKMNLLQKVNAYLGSIDLTSAQLKILSMIVSLAENNIMQADIQQKIDQVPSQKMMRGDVCPFFSPAIEMKKTLIARNILRHQRKRHFLDVLRDFQYLKTAYYTIGVSYFDRKIAELESQLAKLQSK